MADAAVTDFIHSQRNKLYEEKSRLSRPFGGILPTDRHNDRRPHNDRAVPNKQTRPVGSSGSVKSISELRTEMAKEREQELMSRHSNRKGKGRLDWDEEERGILTWAREKGNVQAGPESRSLLLPGLIREETMEQKRQKQNAYRAELLAQMNEKKNKLAKSRDEETVIERRQQRYNDVQISPNNDDIKRHYSPPPTHLDTHQHVQEDHHHPYMQYPPNPYYYMPPYPPPPSNMPYPPVYQPPSHHIPYPPPPSHHNPYPPPPSHHNPYPPPPSHHFPPYYPSPPHQSYYHPRPVPFMEPHESYGARRSRRRSTPPSRTPSPREDQKTMIKWKKSEEEVEKKPRSSLKEILDQQVRERRERKDKENREREKFIKKMESDEYDPWGRPGGGAPLTDSSGKLITERGMMRKSFDGTSPRLSEEEKKRIQQQKQKEELTLQIKEKEEKKLKEKLVQQQTDEYEEERIRREVENLRMQSLKEKEMEKENKEKKVEVSPRPPSGTAGMSKQEIVEMQIKMEMENKKRKQKEEDERLQRLAEKMASNTRPDYNRRNPSPPLPALQKANDSPPVPALRETQPALSDALYTTRPLTTTKSNVILNPPPQLSSVNEAISISSVEPVHLTGSASYTIPVNPVSQTTNSLPQSPEVMRLPPPDIDKASSEVSLMGNLSALKKQLRRNLTPQSTHSNPPIKLRPSIPKRREQSKPPTRFNDTIDTFNSIKYSNPTNSRLSFLKEYPVPPTTLSSLEIQQDALLEHQKQRNARVSDGWSLPRPPSGQSLITVNTMDIDGLAARNQERAKRLEAILNARQVDQDQSQQDHRGILTSFMEGLDRKHRHRVDHVNSETSLDCDTVFHPLN